MVETWKLSELLEGEAEVLKRWRKGRVDNVVYLEHHKTSLGSKQYVHKYLFEYHKYFQISPDFIGPLAQRRT